MRYLFLYIFSTVAFVSFSQQKIVESFFSKVHSIEVNTTELDELKILNSKNENIEIVLFDENPNTHQIIIDEKTSVLKIDFQRVEFNENNSVFRKFITKRLNRASAVIKIPKNKTVTVLGTNIDVISENYNGNINIYIDKGYINLNQVQQNVVLNLFQGNVFATLLNSAIHVKSVHGNIIINKKNYFKEYKKERQNTGKNFSVFSINANLNIKTK